MHTYKLKYNSKEEALNDLAHNNVILNNKVDDLNESSYCKNTLAVVLVGRIIDQPATYDDDENIISEATYIDGYHVDLMTKDPIIFQNEITTENPVHKFG